MLIFLDLTFRFWSDQSHNRDGFLMEYSTQGHGDWNICPQQNTFPVCFFGIPYLMLIMINLINFTYVNLIKNVCMVAKKIHSSCLFLLYVFASFFLHTGLPAYSDSAGTLKKRHCKQLNAVWNTYCIRKIVKISSLYLILRAKESLLVKCCHCKQRVITMVSS